MSEWLMPPWDAIAVIVTVASVGYLIERLFVGWMMRAIRPSGGREDTP